jgi:hypothetical protein
MIFGANMKTRVMGILLVVAVLGVVLMSCNTQNTPPAFVGTWVGTSGLDTWTFVFSTETVSTIRTGASAGSAVLAIQAIDEAADHIQLSQTSATGSFAIDPDGTILYMTYSIIGDSLLLRVNTGTYPPSAIDGPFLRQ